MSIRNARTRSGRSAGSEQDERPLRSLLKAVSWRVTGSVDTMLLSWLFTDDLRIAAAIGLTEVATKTVVYYLHERAWNRVALGRNAGAAGQARDRPALADRLAPLKESAACHVARRRTAIVGFAA